MCVTYMCSVKEGFGTPLCVLFEVNLGVFYLNLVCICRYFVYVGVGHLYRNVLGGQETACRGWLFSALGRKLRTDLGAGSGHLHL